MENNTNYYQLAHTYHNYIKTQFHNRYSIDNSSIMQRGLHFPTSENIFCQDNGQTSTCRLENLAEPNYKLVGAKEVMSYKQRLQKKRRNQNSAMKYSDSALSLPHPSNNRIVQIPQRLTKDQVMEMCTKANQTNNTTGEQVYLRRKNRDQMQTTINSNYTGKEEITLTTNSPLQETEKHHFTVSKIKQRLELYQRQWQKIIENKQNKTVNSRKYGHKKLTSLLERVDNFRQFTQERQARTIHEQQQNIQPQSWNSTLRNSISLKQLNNKELKQVVKGGIKCSGMQKKGKQLAWIEQKDKEGCHFRKKYIKQRDSIDYN